MLEANSFLGVEVGHQSDSCKEHCYFSRLDILPRVAANSFLGLGWGEFGCPKIHLGMKYRML